MPIADALVRGHLRQQNTKRDMGRAQIDGRGYDQLVQRNRYMAQQPANIDPHYLLEQFRASIDRSASLSALCSDYEDGLLSAVAESSLAILGATPASINQSDAYERSGFLVRVGEQHAYFAIQPARWESNTLVITIHEATSSARKAVSLDETVDGSWGRYGRVRVESSKLYDPFAALLLQNACRLCTAFYTSLWTDIQNDFDRDHEELSRVLYSIVRRSLSMTPTAHSRVYLYAAFKLGDNFVSKYIPDSSLRDTMIKRLSADRDKSPHSPVELFVSFTDRTLDYDKTFTKQAVQALKSGSGDNDLVRGDFGIASYKSDPIVIAEQVVYDGMGNAVQALVAQGPVILAAGYPRDLENAVAPNLRAYRQEFQEAVANCNRRYLNRIRKILQLDSRPSAAAMAGEFMGGVMVQFWKHFEKKGSLPS
jgi:hypothetical protein